jgi:hypothetical protein
MGWLKVSTKAPGEENKKKTGELESNQSIQRWVSK